MDEEIFKITPDKDRANDLFIIANERLNDIIKVLPRDKTYRILEEYYEIILELLTAVMYLDGYKTLSHKSTLDYCIKNYSYLSDNQSKIIDTLRKFRHGIVYYGKKISAEYLSNNEQEIKIIIKTLNELVKKKLKK